VSSVYEPPYRESDAAVVAGADSAPQVLCYGDCYTYDQIATIYVKFYKTLML